MILERKRGERGRGGREGVGSRKKRRKEVMERRVCKLKPKVN